MNSRPGQTIPILMYHEVSPVPEPLFRKYIVTPPAFRRQMWWLRGASYNPVSLGQLVASRLGGAALPSRPIVITFDDGFQDCIEYAADILSANGFTASFFFVAGLIGRTSRWLLAERGFERQLATMASARRLIDEGFECGAHSLTHPRLATLPEAACREELARSRSVLEQGLGRPVVHMAYPHGSFDARVRELAGEAGYQTACTVAPGFATPLDDLLTLPRIIVSGHDTLADFAWRLRTATSIRESVRNLVRGDGRRSSTADPTRSR